MPSESGPLRWYGQRFEGVAIPDGVSEEARLRFAPIGVYEMFFRQQPRYEFSGAFLFNGARPQSPGQEGQRQFEATEDTSGVERTLTIQRTGGDIPFESLEFIPLDLEERPIDFTRLEAGARRCTIRYSKDAPPESLKIRLPGINVFDVETVAACLWASGEQYSPEPLAAVISRDDGIRVDRISNPTGKTRKLEEHLLALFDALPDKAAERACRIQCDYQYQLSADGSTADVPVVLADVSPLASASFSELAEKLLDWYQEMAPRSGAFVIKLRVFGINTLAPPALHLTQMLLPSESIAELERVLW